MPLKKCVKLPPSPCVHSHGPGLPSLTPRGNPITKGCSSSGAGCLHQSCTSLSISDEASVSVAACTIVIGGTRRMNVTHSRVLPSLSVVRPAGNGVPSRSNTGLSYTVT